MRMLDTALQTIDKTISVLREYEKDKDFHAHSEQIVQGGLRFLNRFVEAREYLLGRVDYRNFNENRIAESYTYVRNILFEERVPGYAPGFQEWNRAIDSELLKIVCRFVDIFQPHIKALMGIAYGPDSDFSAKIFEDLIGFFTELRREFVYHDKTAS